MWLVPPVTSSSSLLQFKSSVSKSCRAIIQTSFFIDLHTNTNTTTSYKLGTFILQQANLHTNTTTTFNNSSSSKFGTFIFQTIERSKYEYGPYRDFVKLYMLSSPGDGDGDGEDDEDDPKKKKKLLKLDDLGFLPFYKDYQLQDTLRMIGSCNGIICLHDPDVLDDHRGFTRQHYSNLRNVYLWNPATRQFRILPKSIPVKEGQHEIGHLPEYGTEFVAFGFDVKTNDYKVLKITSLKDVEADIYSEFQSFPKKKKKDICRVQVYSLSTDSWRLLEGIDSLPAVPTTQDRFRNYERNHGIYLNGSYFFVGTKPCTDGVRDDFMLLSFDFTKEIFTTVQLPNVDNSRSVLSYLGDKMAVFTTPRIDDDCDDDYDCDGDGDGGYSYYDIWVLNEQHISGSVVVNKECWTKLQYSFRARTYSEPRCISNNGEFALVSTKTYDVEWKNKLQFFNLITKEAKKGFLIGTQVCRADVYKESQVSIMGGNVLLRWQLPTHGTTYKLNLDAPFIASYRSFGIGLCLTSDDTGGCIGVRSLKRSVRDAEQGEALSMLEAIKWAKKLELSPIIIESNSKKCVSFFMDDDDDDDDDDDNNSIYWSLGALKLLRKGRLLLNSSELGSISFQYCSRSCNYVADIAAKLGREQGDWVWNKNWKKLDREQEDWACKDWTANFPGEIVMSLSKDLGLETRKGGELSL